jgi:hypothetical protein
MAFALYAKNVPLYDPNTLASGTVSALFNSDAYLPGDWYCCVFTVFTCESPHILSYASATRGPSAFQVQAEYMGCRAELTRMHGLSVCNLQSLLEGSPRCST